MTSPPSPRKRTEDRLQQRIQELYTEHNCKVDSPMITANLRSEVEFSHVGKNRVARLMKEAGLQYKTTKKFRTTTDLEKFGSDRSVVKTRVTGFDSYTTNQPKPWK